MGANFQSNIFCILILYLYLLLLHFLSYNSNEKLNLPRLTWIRYSGEIGIILKEPHFPILMCMCETK